MEKGTLVESYSFPFARHNQDQKLMKHSLGFMNDSSYKNASDPNSMIDQGVTRNAVYNVDLTDVPNINSSVYSKSLNIHNQEVLNRSFYSFGGKHTNIRNQFMGHSQSAKLLDKQFKDINQATITEIEGHEIIAKPSNVVMNDYTKNISQSIFTPGVYK